MVWEIAFTKNYQAGLADLENGVVRSIDRFVARLRENPFGDLKQAKHLKGGRNLYSARIRGRMRLLYRIDQVRRLVTLTDFDHRKDAYRHGASSANMAELIHFECPPAEILPNAALKRTRESFAPVASPPAPEPATPVLPSVDSASVPPPRNPKVPEVVVEPIVWLTEEEIYRLQIPERFCSQILGAGSWSKFEKLKLPPGVKNRITDYWTNTGATQLEKLYLLDPADDTEAIAKKPLRSFLLALDPDQKAALERLKTRGPYLIKGGAGTGKTLVGLYHIRNLVMSRDAEEMFVPESATRYGVLTFTNSLAAANLAALISIVPPDAQGWIHSSTLDRLSSQLATKAIGRRLNPIDIDGLSGWIKTKIMGDRSLPSEVRKIVSVLGPDYVAEEVEHVINGNGMTEMHEYVGADRRGRKRAIRTQDRPAVWSVHERLSKIANELHMQTWEQIRHLALNYLREDPDYPRFSALFVDEAQDFSKVSKLLCLELVRDPRFLVMAADTAQTIYALPASWKSIHARFANQGRRSVTLTRGYRSTHEINEAIKPLREDPGDDDDQSPESAPTFSGTKPAWIRENSTEHLGIVSQEIARLTRGNRGIHAGQIAVIVRSKAQTEVVDRVLSGAGIQCHVVSKGSPIDLDAPKVHILTAHSAKGLDFPIVFVPEVSGDTFPDPHAMDTARDDEQREQRLALEKRLLYVALSRASSRLYLLTDPEKPSPLLAGLKPESWAT
jgi:superfamily I DNA/RNA helicase/mRNA-degrading endonuclease RelE of RelBE toxin-antitoxin system